MSKEQAIIDMGIKIALLKSRNEELEKENKQLKEELSEKKERRRTKRTES